MDGLEQDTVSYPYYIDNGNLFTGDVNTPIQRYYNAASAPTLQMVLKWLRESHNICVYCYPSNLKEYGIWEAGACWIQENICVIFNNNSHSVYADSYEEACEEAIKYCLTNLI